jgi:DNA-binding response OmpR family regulator
MSDWHQAPWAVAARLHFACPGHRASMAKILVVEDEPEISEAVVDKLTALRHAVDAAFTGDSAIGFIDTYPYDLVLLDINLPAPDGLQILKHIRSNRPDVKVMMLTSKAEIDDRLAGFAGGADDYLAKPFDLREVVARVNALLSRPVPVSNAAVTMGSITLDKTKFEAKRGADLIHLQRKDFLLIEFLMRHPGEAFSAETLLDRLWSADSNASKDGLRMAVSRVRKALDPPNCARSIIESVNRVGYRIDSDSDALKS